MYQDQIEQLRSDPDIKPSPALLRFFHNNVIGFIGAGAESLSEQEVEYRALLDLARVVGYRPVKGQELYNYTQGA